MRPRNLEKEEAIRTVALRMIAEDGLENLSMQVLAKAAGVSPRTIYIKYQNKEDFLVKLYIEVVMESYEEATLAGFSTDMTFAEGLKKLWLNGFRYLKNNRPQFALIRHGKSSPLLNKAFAAMNIREGQYFAPVRQFIDRNIAAGIIPKMPFDVYRALLFSPLTDLMSEYYDYQRRPKQIITERMILKCCEAVAKGLMKEQ